VLKCSAEITAVRLTHLLLSGPAPMERRRWRWDGGNRSGRSRSSSPGSTSRGHKGHPFYKALNRLLSEAHFDRWIEDRCQPFYDQDESRGQRSIPPGVDFRILLVGYFEGIDSQRGIAWRCADSLSLRELMGISLDKSTPDHSTLSITRGRLPTEVFNEVFQFVLKNAADKKLLSGKTVGVDSTTLEANAAMKSIVRRETGEDWKDYVTRLMREEGVIAGDDDPTDEEVRSRREAGTGRSGARITSGQ